jgi:hypothetical protein
MGTYHGFVLVRGLVQQPVHLVLDMLVQLCGWTLLPAVPHRPLTMVYCRVLQVTDAAVREVQQQLAAKEAQLGDLQGTLRLLQELADQRAQQMEQLRQQMEQQEQQHQQRLLQERQQHERDLAQVRRCAPLWLPVHIRHLVLHAAAAAGCHIGMGRACGVGKAMIVQCIALTDSGQGHDGAMHGVA